MRDERPFILTLKLDADSQAFFDAMRERHFPPERNSILAHVTLFHAIPGDKEDLISPDISDVCRDVIPFPVAVRKLRSLGKGVAYVLDSDELRDIWGELAREWRPFLTAQDSQKFAAHVTVQNKVTPERAKRLYSELEAGFEPFEARSEGLILWRYLGGPWDFVEGFDFPYS